MRFRTQTEFVGFCIALGLWGVVCWLALLAMVVYMLCAAVGG